MAGVTSYAKEVQPSHTVSPRDDIVCVNSVSFRYPDGNLALRELDLRIKRGEKVALVGPNGAGKSTLLLHLNGVLGALDGSVRIGDLEVRRATLPEVRARVGLVFQDPDDQLFSPTVFDDVAFGPLHMGLPEAEVRQRVQWALEQVGMQGFDDRMPHHMSVGQRKRVSIATVLSMEPSVLALDEPSAGLDPRARRSLIQLLAALPQTLLVSTHDMPMVSEVFERTVVLADGAVVHDGPTAQVLGNQALLQQYGLEMS